MGTETISLNLDIEVTNWNDDHYLDIKVFLDNNCLYTNTKAQGRFQVDLQDINITESEDHLLEVKVDGMVPAFTKTNANHEIIKDTLVVVHNVSLDDIPLDYLTFEKSRYMPIYPENVQGPEILEKKTHMGHNGTWNLAFSSPVYLWLLENM